MKEQIKFLEESKSYQSSLLYSKASAKMEELASNNKIKLMVMDHSKDKTSN